MLRDFSVIAIWFLLILATSFSWWMSVNFGVGQYAARGGILLIVWFKVRFVILDFMEVRKAPLVLRITLELWMVLVVVMLFGFFWASPY